MHLPPSVWGPFFWHTIHISALGYPSNPSYGHKKAAKEFYESLMFLIPCPVCREHYAEYMKTMPVSPFLDRREDLFKWTVELHNTVNQKLGKPRVTELESIEFYKRLGARGRSPVLNSDDFAEGDLRAMIKGLGIGIATTVTLGAIFWYVNQGESSK